MAIELSGTSIFNPAKKSGDIYYLWILFCGLTRRSEHSKTWFSYIFEKISNYFGFGIKHIWKELTIRPYLYPWNNPIPLNDILNFWSIFPKKLYFGCQVGVFLRDLVLEIVLPKKRISPCSWYIQKKSVIQNEKKKFWNIVLFSKILWKSEKNLASTGSISFGQVDRSWTKIF